LNTAPLLSLALLGLIAGAGPELDDMMIQGVPQVTPDRAGGSHPDRSDSARG
jgi:hypothetical protein